MKSDTAKVLHPILGKPILGHVLDAVMGIEPEQAVVVVGHQRDRVTEYLRDAYPAVLTGVQQQQLGTGNAVRCAFAALAEQGIELSAGPVIVVAGDTPLLTAPTLAGLLQEHQRAGAAVTVLSAELPDATGYGRIVRDADGSVTAIVEHKDADSGELAINEINSGMYAFDRDVLTDALSRLRTDNSQGEEYLTDVLGIARSDGRLVAACIAGDAQEVHGINDRVQLAQAATMLQRRINDWHMRNGVTIVDPDTAWIEPGAAIAPDAVIERNSQVDATSQVAAGAVIGPDTTLLGTRVGEAATVLRSHCVKARIGASAKIGPFTFLRPGADLASETKVGAFVEVKKSKIGKGSKVPHLSYVGDAEIGEGTNIGAATIFVNYDGIGKHPTVVGDQVRIGSDSMLVAPVVIGDGAYTAAGSVITQDVPPGAMAIGRARQANLDGWVERRRPGTESAAAAAQALAAGGNEPDSPTTPVANGS